MTGVLIVDDSNTMRMMLHEVIEGHSGLKVVGSARSAEEALAAIENKAPHIVLIDLIMPHIDGTRLLSMLDGYPALTKVVLSSRCNDEVERKLFQLGASAFFDKKTVVSNPAGFRDRLLKLQKAGSVPRVRPTPVAPEADRSNVIMAANRFPVPADETARVKKLAELQVANMDVDPCLDIIVRHLAEQTRFPIAAVTLVDADTSWAKATVGIARGPFARHQSLCAYALCETGPMIVTDTVTHPVYSQMDMVLKDPCVRSYAGVPIMSKDGVKLGAICVADSRPRNISSAEIAALTSAARLVADFLQTPVIDKSLAA